jgi:nitric oxide reductase subunit B
MTYRTQRVAYAYFAAALLLFALQVAFGFLSLAKYLGPDPLLDVMNFATTKAIHTNLLLVWLLTGFMGAAFYLVPEESRTELHSERLAYLQLGLWLAAGVAAVVGYLFGVTEGRKFLEMPFVLKLGVVVVMLMFLYNLAMTIRKAGRFTTTEGVLVGGLAAAALLFLPGLLHFDNYTLDRFYRWWVVHLWVEGVWELIMGALLAFLLIRLSGADREVMEK